MKKLVLLTAATLTLSSFGQGARMQPGGAPTPVPVYNISQIVSNVLLVVGTNFGIGYQFQTSDTNLLLATNTSTHVYTGHINPASYQTIGGVNTISNILANLSGGFHILIANGSTAAQIQSIFNSHTNGVVEFQPGLPYSITTNIWLTNFSGAILGNGCVISNAANVPGYLLTTGTNYQKSLVIDNLIFNGGNITTYNDVGHFSLLNGSAEPYYNPNWINQGGLYIETSQGVRIQNCFFTAWKGSACMAMSVGGTLGAQGTGKFEFLFNRCFKNFIGVMASGVQYETPGYYNSDSSLWLEASAEYCLIEGNDITANQFGICATAGNHLIQGNTINDNYIGVGGFSGPNCLHGRLCGNTINHNTHAFILEGCTSGELIYNNYFLADGDMIANGIGQLQLSYNSVGSTYIIVTNGGVGAVSSGFITFNMFDATAVWGVTNVPGIWTNIAPTMVVQGNSAADGTNSDGTVTSLTILANGYSDNTNYVASRFIPPITSGTFKMVPSNGWVWAVSKNFTNRLFQVSQ